MTTDAVMDTSVVTITLLAIQFFFASMPFCCARVPGLISLLNWQIDQAGHELLLLFSSQMLAGPGAAKRALVQIEGNTVPEWDDRS